MIDKQEFYHGVAVIRLLEDERCQKIRKLEFGYAVNERVFIFLKYSTKSHSPWRFSFGAEEVRRLDELASSFEKIVLVLICGGDGICALEWRDAIELLGNQAGWISTRRNFNEQYGVAGPNGKLAGKISHREWPVIVFREVSCQVVTPIE